MKNRKILFTVFVMLFVITFAGFLFYRNADSCFKASPARPSSSSAAPSSVFSFKNEKALKEHYNKHGKEMGFESKEAYVAAANEVINNPDSLFKYEEEDGDFVYYLESENYIVFLSQKSIIRSFFAPFDGIAYFNRQ